MGTGRESPEVFPDALADRFEGRKPSGLFHGVDAHAIGGAMIDGGEHGDIPPPPPVAVASYPTSDSAPRPRSSPRAGYHGLVRVARRGERLVFPTGSAELNATHLPSGEKNGGIGTPSDPAIGAAAV